MTWKDRLKRAWDENPAQVIMATGFAAHAAAVLVNAVSAAQSRRAYSRQIDYKIKTGR